MLFHDCATAPSPRCVRIFLAEKGVTVPVRQVDLMGGEHMGPAFRARFQEAFDIALDKAPLHTTTEGEEK